MSVSMAKAASDRSDAATDPVASLAAPSEGRSIQLASIPERSPAKVATARARALSFDPPPSLRTEARKDLYEVKGDGTLRFKEIKALKFPLFAASDEFFLEKVGIGAAILQLLGVSLPTAMFKHPKLLAFPKCSIVAGEGFKVMFFREDQKPFAKKLHETLSNEGCTTATFKEQKPLLGDFHAAVVIQSPSEYLAFLATHCKLNKRAILHYLKTFDYIMGQSSGKSSPTFKNALDQEDCEIIERPEPASIIEAYVLLLNHGIIKE